MKFGIRPEDFTTRRKPRRTLSREETQRLDDAAKLSVLRGKTVDQQLITSGKVAETLREEEK